MFYYKPNSPCTREANFQNSAVFQASSQLLRSICVLNKLWYLSSKYSLLGGQAVKMTIPKCVLNIIVEESMIKHQKRVYY